MKAKTILALIAGILFFPAVMQGQPRHVPSRDEILNIVKDLKYQGGDIALNGGLAKLQVATNFHFLNPSDAEKVLVNLWGNPPNQKTLGLLIPADKTPLDDECWVVTISYTDDGYVKDDDAGKINYDDLLKDMKKGVKEASAEREKQGYPAVELVGWAAPPRYDAATHKLYWAKELKFGHGEDDTLNYNIRMLGRHGVLVLNAVAPMSRLAEIEKEAPNILSMVNFNDGNRYADFDPKVDKVATYGIAALVAGGIAAKLGLFKLLWVGILALKKFVIIGVVAVVAWVKKLLGKDKVPPPAPTPQS
jgi:uncharacterized membrane-anchored protein